MCDPNLACVWSTVSQVAEERLANMRTVRAFVQEHNESLVYNTCIDHVLQLSYKEALARGVFWAMVMYECCYGSEISLVVVVGFEGGNLGFDVSCQDNTS